MATSGRGTLPAGTLLTRFRDQLTVEGRLRPHERVVVGVSGRADSVALLTLLRDLAPEWSLHLVVAHVQATSTPEARADADFVRNLAHTLALPFEEVTIHAAHAEAHAQWAERSRRLEEIRERVGAATIATGETADDAAETLLAMLLQAAAPLGEELTGNAEWLRGSAGGRVYPLFSFTHDECHAFLAERGVAFRHDPEALHPLSPRRKLRLLFLPFVRHHLSGMAPQNLAVAARALADDARFLQELSAAAQAEVHFRVLEHAASFDHARWVTLPGPLRQRLLAEAIRSTGAGEPPVTRHLLLRLEARCRTLREGSATTEEQLNIALTRGTLTVSVRR